MQRITKITLLPVLIGLLLVGATVQTFQGDRCDQPACCCSTGPAHGLPDAASNCCPSEISCCDARAIPNRADMMAPVPSQCASIWHPLLQTGLATVAAGGSTLPYPGQAYPPSPVPISSIPIYLWNLAILC